MILGQDDPLAVELVHAVQGGDLESLKRLLAEHPGLARVRIAGRNGRSNTPLHVASDWPGYFPNGPAVVRALLAAGADPNAPVEGASHAETPLHWAASSDDVEVADALIAGGADIEATGASIAGGTPLDDAIGYAQRRERCVLASLSWGTPSHSRVSPRPGCRCELDSRLCQRDTPGDRHEPRYGTRGSRALAPRERREIGERGIGQNSSCFRNSQSFRALPSASSRPSCST